MELEADRRPVGPGERGERREVGRRDDLRVRRLDHDLVLVRRGNGDLAFAVGSTAADRTTSVAVKARAPALGRLDDLAAERLRHHLVAEADADHLRLAGVADELQQRRDPRQRVVNARRRAGDQISVMRGRFGQLARSARRTSRFRSRRRAARRTCRDSCRTRRQAVPGGTPVSRIASFMARRLATSLALRPRRSDGERARGTPCADHRRRHRHRRRRRPASQRRRRETVAARAPDRAAAAPSPRSFGGAAIQCDVTDPERIRAAFDEARAVNGPIDLLIVNAGIAESAPFHKMTRESWDRIIATNLTAAFDCAQRGDRRPAQERQRPAGVRRLGRGAARRSLCRALRRVEARPARPDAQPRRRICEDQPDGERGLPGLCRHADDRPVGRARVARSPAAARTMRARRSPT